MGSIVFVNTEFAYNLHLKHFSTPENNIYITELKIPKNCKDHETYSWQLNDRVYQYLEESYLNGIRYSIKHAFQIESFVKTGALIPILNSDSYIIDTLKYSHPFLTPKAKNLLSSICSIFQSKIKNTNAKGAKLIITSLLRTTTSIKRLRKVNKNAIRHSAHLHGTTFDISYEAFQHHSYFTHSELEILKEVLAKALFELRTKNKCWVTYEKSQSCFHIVSR